MHSDQLAFTLLVPISFIVATSCGGKAIIDSGVGVGGTGASSTSSSGTGGTSSGTGGTSSGTGGTGGGTIAEACAQVCALLEQCDQTEPGCIQECQIGVSPDCESEYHGWLTCLASFMGPPACEMPFQCEDELDLYSMCEGGPEPPPPCSPGPCYTGSDGSCGCEAMCPGGLYATDCAPSGGSMATCTCSINSNPIGSCTDQLGMEACDIYTGCCAPFFFGYDE